MNESHVDKLRQKAEEENATAQEQALDNAKRERFCQEYVIDCNGTQAAIRAGYSERTAQQQSSDLLSIPVIKERVAELQKVIADECQITATRVLQELALLGFSNIADYVTFDETGVTLKPSKDLTREQLACVLEVSETLTRAARSRKFRLHDKKGPLELLGKHLKLFTDKTEVETGATLAALFAELAASKKSG